MQYYVGLLIAMVMAGAVLPAAAEVYRLPEGARAASLHVMVAAPASKEAACEMRWQAQDSLNYCYAAVHSDGLASIDEISGAALTLTRGISRGGIRKNQFSKTFIAPLRGDSVACALHFDATAAKVRIRAGARRSAATEEFPAAIDSIGSVILLAGGAAKVSHCLWQCDSVPAPRLYDADSLGRLLEASKNPREGRWIYFDRNTDPLLSRMGGSYMLATVERPDGSGDYDIIYLGGASEQSAQWAPGRLKGVLRATSIPEVYDLEWVQPDGAPVTADTGATFEGHFLILQFPRWKATVRLRRALPSE